jgi:hypothetical protein
VNGHFPAQPFGFSPVLGLNKEKIATWYTYHERFLTPCSPKTGPNAAANETSTDPSKTHIKGLEGQHHRTTLQLGDAPRFYCKANHYFDHTKA